MKRESERNAKTKLAIDPWLIGYATVVFWVQFAAGSWFSGTAEADNVLLRDFAIWAAASQLALAVAYFASIRVFPSLKTWLSETPGTTAASIASTLASLGILILLANARWYILAGIVFGAGCIVSYALWGQLMSRRSFASILANTLIGQGVGAVLVYTASLLEWNRALWLIAVALFASSLCLVACAIGTRRQRIVHAFGCTLWSDFAYSRAALGRDCRFFAPAFGLHDDDVSQSGASSLYASFACRKKLRGCQCASRP